MPESRDPQLDELRRRARRRLVGAVVLALAAAVLVPMLLESDPRPLGEDVAVKIPPVDDGKFVSKVGERAKSPETAASAPKGESAPASVAAEPPRPAAKDAPAETAAPESAPASSNALQSAEQKVLSPPVRPAAKESAPAAEPAKAASAAATEAPAKASAATARPEAPKAPAQPAEAAKAGGYSVQLAAFIDDKGANALAGRLKRAGYPAYTEPYTTSRGTLWRVRVGPYPSRDVAEAVRLKLKGDGQNGIITAAK